MSFEEIFRQWESQYPADPAAKGDGEPASSRGREPVSPRALPIDDEIDLHGMTAEEARAATGRFIEASLAAGHRKVLVVHGKGLHSQNGGVLKAEVRRFLERHPDTGAMGTPKRHDGGSGALWVVLRQRSR